MQGQVPKINSFNDYVTLEELTQKWIVKDVKPLFSSLIHVAVTPDASQLPWLHRVILLGMQDANAERFDAVALDASLLGCNNRAPRSIYNCLPRVSPSLRRGLRSISVLKFVSAHFKDCITLSKILRSMPLLVQIYLENLSWDQEPTAATFMSLRFHRLSENINSVCVAMETVDPLPLAAWLLPVLYPEEWQTALYQTESMVQFLPNDLQTIMCLSELLYLKYRKTKGNSFRFVVYSISIGMVAHLPLSFIHGLIDSLIS